jgi:Flp pilus assembly protein TadG
VRRFLATYRSRHSSESGAALVEFALILPLLLVLLLGILEFGKAFNYWIDQTHLANEGARWAVVDRNPGAADGWSLQQYVQQHANTPELRDGGTASVPSALQICISFPSNASEVGDPVKVTATSTYQWLPFLGNRLGVAQTTMTGSATMRLEAEPTAYEAGCS